jgi:3' terminal RNA ribose 2'-O-methyltransferase Hen1
MLLTLEASGDHADSLGYLLHKHPQRVQSFELSFGQAHVFYPMASPTHFAACLLLDVDSVGMVRGAQRDNEFVLGQYVNDRPYVASSFLSVAIAQVYGSALAGRCKDRPHAVDQLMPLVATLETLPVRADEDFLHRIFEPLGYSVTSQRHPLDPAFPEWGSSPYHSVTLRATTTVTELLTHLYVLVPVFDHAKHYFVGSDELEKLLEKGSGWLAKHPEKEAITRRYLRHRPSLFREALGRLVEDDDASLLERADDSETQTAESETTLPLNTQRYQVVVEALRETNATRVLDLGCGEGRLLRELMRIKTLRTILGVDVSHRALEIASRRLRLERLPATQAARVQLQHGSLVYRNENWKGYDAATIVEVIEHLDPDRLTAFERVVFEFAKPNWVFVTTPNCEYNVVWESLPAGEFRHADHRFEWTRAEFQTWCHRLCEQHAYHVTFRSIGPEDPTHGPPTQMAVFHRRSETQPSLSVESGDTPATQSQ